MATPEYPSTLPGVTSIQINAESQVIAPEGEAGHLTYRRITRVPAATATLVFNFIEGDFAIFQNFYVETLKRGHKWFSIVLPSAAGYAPHIVKCLKHRSARAPGFNHREVTMTVFIRGRRIYPNDREGFGGGGSGEAVGWNTQNAYGAWSFTNNNYTGEVQGN